MPGPSVSARASSACTSAVFGRVAGVDQHVLRDVARRAGSRPSSVFCSTSGPEVLQAAVGGGEPRHAFEARVAEEHRRPLKRPQKPLTLYGVKHPYRIREIAAQSGLSEATVDRVLHGRGGVRESTVREVQQAIADLDRQRSQVRLGGRTFMFDVVMQAPPRFSAAVRAALEAELPALRPAVIRSRFHLLDEPGDRRPGGRCSTGSSRTRSHGVILKAPDVPEVVAAVDRLGVPVVTLVTDLPTSRRVALRRDRQPARPGRPRPTWSSSGWPTGPGTCWWSAGTARSAARTSGRRASGPRCSAGARPATARGGRRGGPRRTPCTSAPATLLAGNPSVRAVYSLYAGAGGNAAVRGRLRGRAPAVRRLRRARPGRREHRRCCGSAGCPRCCTTICGRTCAGPATRSCRRAGPCPGRSAPTRPPSR